MASLDVVPYDFFGKGKLTIYFFIGRMNPPHAGHEGALRQLMEKAMEDRSIPLILAGSGPNGGERTLDNPLTFVTKQRVLKYRLSGSLCEIREKTNPVADVLNWMEEIMRNTGQTVVEFKLVTGDKGENATKLDGILQGIVKTAQKKGIQATGSSVAIRAIVEEGVEMSATQVRKDALKALVSGDRSFHEKYSGYYGPHTENVYGEIAQIASTMPQEQVMDYIATGELPKTKSKSAKSSKPKTNSPKSKKKRKKEAEE
jgi:nicotinamide mononucleotide adenylyltransferase